MLDVVELTASQSLIENGVAMVAEFALVVDLVAAAAMFLIAVPEYTDPVTGRYPRGVAMEILRDSRELCRRYRVTWKQ